MSKSFQQLLFFFIISIPLTAQEKNGIPGLFAKTVHTNFCKYTQPVVKITGFSKLSKNLPFQPKAYLQEPSVIKSKSILKSKNRMNLAKDITIMMLSSVMIVSFVRFRKIRKKQRSKLRQILRNRHQLPGETRLYADKKAVYGFPNISIEETFGEDDGLNRPKTESLMTSETENKLLEMLNDFESGTLYNSKNMSLPFLAGELNTNTKYLSFIINRYKSADFKTYINRLRIEYIVGKLSEDEKYRQYKISILADECGFSSHSKFAAIFKAMTDYSPSAYIKLLDSGDQPDIKRFL